MFDEYIILSDAYVPCLGPSYYTLAPYHSVVEVVMDDDDHFDAAVSNNNKLVGDSNTFDERNQDHDENNDSTAAVGDNHFNVRSDDTQACDEISRGKYRDMKRHLTPSGNTSGGGTADRKDTTDYNVSATPHPKRKVIEMQYFAE